MVGALADCAVEEQRVAAGRSTASWLSRDLWGGKPAFEWFERLTIGMDHASRADNACGERSPVEPHILAASASGQDFSVRSDQFGRVEPDAIAGGPKRQIPLRRSQPCTRA